MTKPHVFKKRLLKLAEFLEKLPRKRFNYTTWAGTVDKPYQGKADLSCGTTACALGWATTIPAFRRLGLRMVAIHDYDYRSGAPREYQAGLVTTADGGDEHDAAELVFDLDYDEANHLFRGYAYAIYSDDAYQELQAAPLEKTTTPKQVAKVIRKFVAYKYPEGAQ